MKNLRHLFRRNGLYASEPRRGRSTHAVRGGQKRRRLQSETLEKRQLLAGDLLASHNVVNPHDVNGDGRVTARDAIGVVNYLGRTSNAEAELLSSGGGSGKTSLFYDVNADTNISPSDALSVINQLARAEAANHEVVELVLTARDLDDNQISNATGEVTVDVNEPFFIEIAYDDLRTFIPQAGAFDIRVNLDIGQPGVLVPVLAESQILRIGDELIDAARGGVVDRIEFRIDQLPPGVGPTEGMTLYESLPGAFGESAEQEVRNALAAFGYTESQYKLDPGVLFQDDDGTDDFGFEITWLPQVFGGVDLPNINVKVITSDNTEVLASSVEIPHDPLFIDDDNDGVADRGNSAAIRRNLDFRSRTANNSLVYATVPTGDIDPVTGDLTKLGGLTLNFDDFNVPPGAFDAFSVLVQLTEPVENLDVSIRPSIVQSTSGGDEVEILLFGREEPITPDEVLLQAIDTNQNGIAVLKINPASQNQNPVVETALSTTVSEDDGVSRLDLLAGASDPDGDTLDIANLQVDSDPETAVIVDATTNELVIDPSEYGPLLNQGQQQEIVVSYDIIDGNGGSVSQTATVIITGADDVVNQPPVVTGPVTSTLSEDDPETEVDLRANASDPDGDDLIVSNVVVNNDPSSAVEVVGNVINVDPTVYGEILNDNDQQIITLTYQISDGNGGSVNQSATVTINGLTDNQPPTVADPIVESFQEDDEADTVDLLAGASDPDGDTLSVAGVNIQNDTLGGVSVTGNTLNVTPQVYGGLNTGQSQVITVNYQIEDGNGGSVNQTATITIVGETDIVNQPPTVTGPINRTINEEAGTTNISLLLNASDPDNDVLEVINAVVSGDTANAVQVNGNTAVVTPGLYDALNDGDVVNITINYDVTDNNGGVVPTTANIVIEGSTDNRPPVVTAAVTALFNEQDATGSVPLLNNASDPDGDTLEVQNLSLVSGNAAGITPSGNSLTVNPNAYGFLVDDETEVVTYTYDVSDGQGASVAQTATVTIEGFNDPPNARDDEGVFAFVNQTININVLSNDDMGDGETGTLNITAVTQPANATVSINNGTIQFVPDAEFIGDTSFTYTVSDGDKEATATVFVSVRDFVPSTIAGSVFRDNIENFQEFLGGADPVRNGIKEDDELGFAGVHVTLTSSAGENSTGQAIERTVMTDLSGAYSFNNLAPGTYRVSASIGGETITPEHEHVIYLGASEQEIVAVPEGTNATNVNWALLGTRGAAANSIDILVSSYRTGGENGREGGLSLLSEDGSQGFFVAGQGFEGVDFAELSLNASRDAALLTIIKDGQVQVANLGKDDFVITNGDGVGVQFFGGLDDLDFVAVSNAEQEVLSQFPDYRDSVDEFFANGNV